MSPVDEAYKLQLTCSNCKTKDQLIVTKREAAFELIPDNYKCKKCSSTSFLIGHEIPIDIEILKEWVLNPDLHLLDQDEDLILAEGNYVDMILQVLETTDISNYKRNILLSALCVIIYENTNDDNDKCIPDIKLKDKVLKELNKRVEKLELANNWIMPYIKEVVYPQLDFSIQK